MKITIQELHQRQEREWRSRLVAGLALALAYAAFVGSLTLLAS